MFSLLLKELIFDFYYNGEKWKLAFTAISLQIFWQKFCRNVPWVVLYQPYEFCPNLWIWLVAMATKTLNLRKNSSTIFFSEALRRMKLKLCGNVHNVSLYKKYVFYSRCSCAFVAMATYNFHTLIMGKVKVGLYFYLTADILTKVFQKCSLSSLLPNKWILSKLMNLIGCYGNRKDKF